jgi:hydroxyacylglutathione hydrolase
MSVSLQMLGTGDAFASIYYNNNGLLTDGDYTLLIDCGVTAPRALHELGKQVKDIDATLITHIHSDHVGGLPELARTLKSAYGRQMTILVPQRLKQPLWNHMVERGLIQKKKASSLEEVFNVTTLVPDTEYKLSPAIAVELIPTKHMPGRDSYSLLLSGSTFYSADMIFQPELLKSLVRERGVRKILHDCQLTGRGQVHTTLEELLSLPEDIRRMIKLMHYSDDKPQYEGCTGEMEFLEQHVIYEL